MTQCACVQHAGGRREGGEGKRRKAAFQPSGNVLERNAGAAAQTYQLIHESQHCLPDLAVLVGTGGKALFQQPFFFAFERFVSACIHEQVKDGCERGSSIAGLYQRLSGFHQRFHQPLAVFLAANMLLLVLAGNAGEGLQPAAAVDAAAARVVFQIARLFKREGRITAFENGQKIPRAPAVCHGAKRA